jgi:hypothetical protein
MSLRARFALLLTLSLAACAHGAPNARLMFTKTDGLDSRSIPCPAHPRVETAGDSLVISARFTEPHAVPIEATLVKGSTRQFLVYGTEPGVLNLVGEYCYRATVRPLQTDLYRLRVGHMVHGVVRPELILQTVLDTAVAIPGNP